MKDLARKRSLISEQVEKALNDQIKLEAHSSAIYLSMSSWLDDHGFLNCSELMLTQSGEEREHMLKFFKYVGDAGSRAISPEITNVPQDFESFRDIFELALEQEIKVTQSIHNLYDIATKAKDYTTTHFLDFFLKEQFEEEFKARRAVELFDIVGTEGDWKFILDKEIPAITFEA